MLTLQYYVDAKDHSPFANWFDDLDSAAVARVTVALTRLGEGKFGNTKSVGTGVLEYRIDFGPGYRVYFGRDGDMLIVLLAGGTKKRQDRDIEAAKQRWQEYKARKRGK
jgi:putative addiction module killer protein